MPGSEEFSTAVRGSGGRPIQTSAAGSIETDNYDHGDGFDVDGDYPHTIDPDRILQVVVLSVVDGYCELEIETILGDTFTIPIEANTFGSLSDWEIESVTIKDPNDNNPRVAGGWAGE